jgi:hypothetical protein
MNDRFQAITILKQARDALLARLTQSVLENEEQILDDAQGYSYGGPIEALHEQLGTRLASVNSLLAQMQAAEADMLVPHHDEPLPEAAPLELLVHAEAFEDGALIGPPSPQDEPASFEAFLQAIEVDDTPRAVRLLAELFGISVLRAEICAVTFRDRYGKSPEFAERAHRLRTELAANANGSLTLLCECFGLAVPESIEVLETLRSRPDYA